MNFFKKRRNAFIIAVLAVVLSLTFGSARSADAEAQKVLDKFSSGNGSILSQLQTRRNCAMNMYTIAQLYSGTDLESAAMDLQSARNDLSILLESGAGASRLYVSNESLQTAAVKYYEILSERNDISRSDLSDLDSDYSTFLNAQRVIGESDYNQYVREFNNNVLDFFPLNLIKSMITTPELFI